jgi:hypothetical protein
MKTKFLLPPTFKYVGWLFFTIGLAMGIAFVAGWDEPQFLQATVPDIFNQNTLGSSTPAEQAKGLKWIENNLSDELTLSFILVGVMLLMLAREKQEDELIMRLRLESILWAAIVNALLVFASTWLVYDMAYFMVMEIAMFLFYLVFVIRFNWVLWRFNAQAHEE